jgi:hypothetical protein
MSNELVPFDADLLGLIQGSFDREGLPLPFVREIFLLETHVAGTSHIEHIENIEKDLSPQEFVVLRREPENPYDELAIVIIDAQGRKIGYVPQDRNEVLARLMDAGKLIFGRVESKKWKRSYLLVNIRIYMRDM